jgi:hypothetical protein
MSIHVFGDSHGHYLFARAGAVSLCCHPGHTMHRVGRDGLDLFRTAVEPRTGDDLIVVFGEIDVRCHLIRVSAAKGWTYHAAVADLAERFIAALCASLEAWGCRPRITVMGVVPPLDPLRANPILPAHGPLRDRLVVWFLLNEALKARAHEAGFSFVPIPTVYHARDGSLRRCCSDGVAHIAKDCTEPVVRAVERALGMDLAFRPLPGLRHLVRSTMRRVALVNRDWAALWALGENVIDA